MGAEKILSKILRNAMQLSRAAKAGAWASVAHSIGTCLVMLFGTAADTGAKFLEVPMQSVPKEASVSSMPSAAST